MRPLPSRPEIAAFLFSRRVLALAGAGLVLVIVILSWWPLTRWQLPRTLANGAEAIEGGGLRFGTPGIARSDGAQAWLVLVPMLDLGLTISLQVKSDAFVQHGPARIFTISRDLLHRNLTIAQEGQDLILRLRSPRSDANGLIAGRNTARVHDVFAESEWRHILVTITANRLRVARDGLVVVDEALAASPFPTWDPSYAVALGNELTGDRPWLGEIRSASISYAGETIDYTAPGRLTLPPYLWKIVSRPRLALIDQTELRDAIENVLFYFPLGFVLGGLARPRFGWRWIPAVFFLSLLMEAGQMAIPARTPALSDVVTNTLGGTIGLALAYGLARLSRRQGRGMPAQRV